MGVTDDAINCALAFEKRNANIIITAILVPGLHIMFSYFIVGPE
jgi:hypothetical protein